MPLELVPPAPPDRKTAMVERLKDIARPDGMLQCNRCGGRDTLMIRNGDRIVGGKIKAGTGWRRVSARTVGNRGSSLI